MSRSYPPAQGLYLPEFEHDSCGVGFICNMRGKATHQLVDDALKMLENMDHRGACGCEPDSGDGAGILVKTPDKFLRRKCKELGINLPKLGSYAVAQVFLPKDIVARYACEKTLEKVIRDYNLAVLGWRDVPVNSKAIGPTPRKVEPCIRQCFIVPADSFYNKSDFDRRLYLVRQRCENEIEFGREFPPEARAGFYICIMSNNRLVYKGMLTALQLRQYYPDLLEPDFESALAIVHSRFSTNTFPSWDRAHPYRYLAHNGEINTLRGNRNWMRSRYGTLKSEVFGDEIQKMFPIVTESGSDSATLDNALQFLVVNGRSLPHSVMMLIPEAWQHNNLMDEDLKAFYEYHACLMEPWDGPASIAFTNGNVVGAVLDRNGLRPSRYYVTKDDNVIMASEVGVLPIDPASVAKKWRLQPGKIFLIDMQKERIVDDNEIKRELVEKRPWRRWIKENLIHLESLPEPTSVHTPDHETLLARQHAFGYTLEDVKILLTPMVSTGIEALGSMGNDVPLACLSDKPQLLYSYFKQLFAQVTNPPLDANFESLVTSLNTYLGREGNLLDENPGHARLVKLPSPVITNEELAKLREISAEGMKSATLQMTFPAFERETGMEKAVDQLCAKAAQAVRDGGEHPDPVGPRRGRGQRPDSGASGDQRGASSPDSRRHPHAVRAGGGIGRTARDSSFLPADRITAPAR